jgi:hypothetical protein
MLVQGFVLPEYDTPNIRVGIVGRLRRAGPANELQILDQFGLQDGQEIRFLAERSPAGRCSSCGALNP